MSEWGNITHLSEPVFDEWGWAPYWKQQEWLFYLNALQYQYGSTEGADRWYRKWASRGFWETLGDERGDWVAFSTPFRQALAEHELSTGINLLAAVQDGVPLSGLMGNASDTVNAAGDALGNIGGSTRNLSETLENITGLTRWFIPVLIMAVAIVLIWILIANRNNILDLFTPLKFQ